MLIIGKIAGTQGIKGELKVFPLTDYPERFVKMREVFVGTEDKHLAMKIVYAKPHKNIFIFKFEAINDIDTAKDLKNKFLLINDADAVTLAEDNYFIHDIIGLDVYLENVTKLGIVKEIFETGSNDVYIVEGEKGQILLPALKSIITIDMSAKKIIVKNMPGLLEGAEEA